MASIYKGRLAVVNNMGLNESEESSIDMSVMHTCNGITTEVFNGLQLKQYEVSAPAEFHSQAGKDDQWDINMIVYTQSFGAKKYTGSFKANYEQKDSPHVILLNLRALVTDKYDNVIMVFPHSQNVSEEIQESKK